ncbi:MAG: flagellar FlbD family protein [Acetobacteraceae bacterium]|nr:flagellar FlbD family protein [Acetobacteraceae bacterium]
MIQVTRLGGDSVVINAELIEAVEATPDTVITLTTGRKLIVQEPVAEVVRRVIQYRRDIGWPGWEEALAHRLKRRQSRRQG